MIGNKSFVFCFADVEVREREFSLIKAGKVLAVEPKAFRVLLLLLRNPQKLISKEELLNSVWGDTAVTEGSLTRCIWLLRRLLGDDVNEPRFIETVATVGYRLVCKVEVSESASGDLQATDKANGLNDGNFVETPANGEISEAMANPLGQIDKLAGDMERSGNQTQGRHNRHGSWLLPGVVILAIGLATAIWYLRRPLPQLRVAEYTQITHDGRPKAIAGTDGSRLYFNWNNQPPAQVAISGGEIAQVPVALPVPRIQDVSPDGSTLLVTSREGGQMGLWAVQVPAGSLRRLLTGAYSAAWSPDGKSVVYSLENGDLSVTKSDGTGTRKLTSPGGLTGPLSWSPDGSKIRFSKDNRLWEVSSDGSGLHPLLPGWRPSSSQCCGHWTPDGKFFVFLSRGALLYFNDLHAASQLWVLDERRGLFRRGPTEPVQLTSSPMPMVSSCEANWSAMTRNPVGSNPTSEAFRPNLSLFPQTVSSWRTSLSPKASCGGLTGMEATPYN